MLTFAIPYRDVSSVGSERMLHTHEVTGSNPVRPTRIPPENIENQEQPLITAAFLLQNVTPK